MMVMSSPTMPGSLLTPKSWRLIFPVAETPRRVLPIALTGAVGPVTSNVTSFVTPLMVRLPVIFNMPSPDFTILVDTKVIVGNLVASKKPSLFRSSSRRETRVSIEATSIEALTVDLVMSESSITTVPVTLVNSPWMLEIPRCRTINCAFAWYGSIFQVLVAAKREPDDVYLWATIRFLADQLVVNDPDAISFTLVLRARDGIRNTAEALMADGHGSSRRKTPDNTRARPPRHASRERARTRDA